MGSSPCCGLWRIDAEGWLGWWGGGFVNRRSQAGSTPDGAKEDRWVSSGAKPTEKSAAKVSLRVGKRGAAEQSSGPSNGQPEAPIHLNA